MTKVYLQFLNDFRSAIVEETSSVWLGGDLDLKESEGNRAQANLLQQMIELEFGGVEYFYAMKDAGRLYDYFINDPDQQESDDNAG